MDPWLRSDDVGVKESGAECVRKIRNVKYPVAKPRDDAYVGDEILLLLNYIES